MRCVPARSRPRGSSTTSSWPGLATYGKAAGTAWKALRVEDVCPPGRRCTLRRPAARPSSAGNTQRTEVMIPVDSQTMFEDGPAASPARWPTSSTPSSPPWARCWPTTLAQYQIDTRPRIVHFLAQTCHESAGFRTTEEFASGDRLRGPPASPWATPDRRRKALQGPRIAAADRPRQLPRPRQAARHRPGGRAGGPLPSRCCR